MIKTTPCMTQLLDFYGNASFWMDFASPDWIAAASLDNGTIQKYLVRLTPQSFPSTAGQPQPSYDTLSTALSSQKKKKKKIKMFHHSLKGWTPVNQRPVWNVRTCAPGAQSHTDENSVSHPSFLFLLCTVKDGGHVIVCSVFSCSYKVLPSSSCIYEHLYLKNKTASIWFFMNTICTVKTPVMKNKNTFQKDQNGIKDPDSGIPPTPTPTPPHTHSLLIHTRDFWKATDVRSPKAIMSLWQTRPWHSRHQSSNSSLSRN